VNPSESGAACWKAPQDVIAEVALELAAGNNRDPANSGADPAAAVICMESRSPTNGGAE
jgi:hypothetical protein